MKVNFGAFEVDLAAGRLLKNGTTIPLREQPFQVLATLLAKPGEIVTRDELRRRLWASDTFVDFEVGLNTAVSRLRQALNDAADSPRFIETIPKRGYRFIAPMLRQPAVAVMPFANQIPEGENDYFSDGLTDELIGTVSRIEGLRVVGRNTVRRFRNHDYDLKEVGRELGVDAVLEGSAWRQGRQIRINLHLVNSCDGFDLWSDRFDGDWKDIFAVQDRVSQCVAEALKVRLVNKAPRTRSQDPEAYTAYLKGHHLVKRHTPANLKRALEYFKDALRLDPGYAMAYHGASVVYTLSAVVGQSPARDALAEADRLLTRGLALDPESAMVQTSVGMLRMFQWRWQESQQAYQRALALEPANLHPHMMYALYCSFRGRHDEALREARKAVELDPVDPMANFRLVQCLYYARQFDAAIQAARKANELPPEASYTHGYLALSLVAIGALDEAWSTAQEARRLGFGEPLVSEGHFGYVAGLTGHSGEAQGVIHELKNRRGQGYCPALPTALVHLGLGELGNCLCWLETALAEREPYLASAFVFPGYDLVKHEVRFKAILNAIGASTGDAVIASPFASSIRSARR